MSGTNFPKSGSLPLYLEVVCSWPGNYELVTACMACINMVIYTRKCAYATAAGGWAEDSLGFCF